MDLTKRKLPIAFKGPPLEEGPLPAFFYFALSAQESLEMEPINRPVALLSSHRIRCFSFTLPAHGPGLDPTNAMETWAREMRNGNDPIGSFLSEAENNIQFLIDRNIINPNHLAVGGLSRGGLIATLLACRDHRLKYLLGFAPVTSLSYLKEFSDLSHHPDLIAATPPPEKLIRTHTRFYIGNHDTRVGTDCCYRFVKSVVEEALSHHLRSPAIELMISRSIGHKGHGTSDEVFASGISWLLTSCFIHHKH